MVANKATNKKIPKNVRRGIEMSGCYSRKNLNAKFFLFLSFDFSHFIIFNQFLSIGSIKYGTTAMVFGENRAFFSEIV